MQITQQWILSHAPSPAVAELGRAISDAGRYSARGRTAGTKAIWAECSGSARNPYSVSVDWSLSEDEPVYSCSCPSRHFPCKHVMGLMYELSEGKPFDISIPPPYVLRARVRQAEEHTRAEERLEKLRSSGGSLRRKRLERQREGLAKAERASSELLRSGLASFAEQSTQSLDRLTAELGGCELTGPRDAIGSIARLLRTMRRDASQAVYCRGEILRILAALDVMIRRSRDFLDEQLASGSYAMEKPILFEALGGVWNPDELRELGLYRKNARLVQLSYDMVYEPSKRAQVGRGFWLEWTRGDIVQTMDGRGAKTPAGCGDSCFGLVEVPTLYEAPVSPCPSVWWERGLVQPMTADERAALRGFAAPGLQDALARAKTILKEPLLPDFCPALVRIGALGTVDGTPVLSDGSGARIELADRHGEDAEHAAVRRLAALPVKAEEGDALFGLLFYDDARRRFCMQPCSLVTAEDVFRLQY